jgi:DNA topoisomerase-3
MPSLRMDKPSVGELNLAYAMSSTPDINDGRSVPVLSARDDVRSWDAPPAQADPRIRPSGSTWWQSFLRVVVWQHRDQLGVVAGVFEGNTHIRAAHRFAENRIVDSPNCRVGFRSGSLQNVVMTTLIITEKSSQARDLRAALGDRFGQILPAEGHLLRLAEPHEVNAAWKIWSSILLKPDDLYPTQPAPGSSRAAKLAAIASALKQCDQVILATDCDREGQLIGQEILEHLRYRGPVRRALFTAQDPKSLRQAFDKLKPNAELQPLYEAAVARQQADQIFNLSLTRTATRSLLTRGTKGVIGIGRVKTPTLAIVCLRELEIRDFEIEEYYEIVATAKGEDGTFVMRHAPPAKARIRTKPAAEAIAKAAAQFTGPVAVSVEHRRQAPPRLFDLPSLQKVCGQRWGWGADKTLAIAQELYDGDGKKLTTYPRAEARHLAENQITDVPAIVAAMTRLRGFAHLEIDPPVIRRGKSGHFCDKSLEGVSHHAIVPNVNVMDHLEARIARLSDDEKRLFALICCSYIAAVMPDFEFQQTVVTMHVRVPDLQPNPVAEFRAVGRIPLKLGWKAAFGPTDAEHGADSDSSAEADQTLPQLTDGQSATLTRPRVQAKKTQPPPRYSEGTLVDAMQNSWRFVKDEVLRERLKEAKGIGTPATRAEIIKGLKRQTLLMADGKFVVPTPGGLQLFELLRSAAPQLVDPGTTAIWEMRLDDVVFGKARYRAVIDEICAEADKLISVLRQHRGATVDLSKPAPSEGARSKASARKASANAREENHDPASDNPNRKRRTKSVRAAAPREKNEKRDRAPQPKSSKPPTEKMIAFAARLAKQKECAPPRGWDTDFDICRSFIERQLGR